MSSAHGIKMTVTILNAKYTRSQKCKIKRNGLYIAVSLGRWTIVVAAKAYFHTKQWSEDSSTLIAAEYYRNTLCSSTTLVIANDISTRVISLIQKCILYLRSNIYF